jgi:hypothetical protein
MNNDIYAFTVPLFIKMLNAMKHVLEKGEACAAEQGAAASEYLEARLAADMFPLARQVQIASDNAKGGVARLSGVEAPKYEDTETTFAELYARIDKTIAFVQSVPESAFADAATRQVTLPYFPGKYMTGQDYAREYLIPNFLFHVVTAYDILRMKGVPLGKADYMNGLPLRDL